MTYIRLPLFQEQGRAGGAEVGQAGGRPGARLADLAEVRRRRRRGHDLGPRPPSPQSRAVAHAQCPIHPAC